MKINVENMIMLLEARLCCYQYFGFIFSIVGYH
jgi:hypothetical protein